jgi:hypothetical protein
MRLMGFYFEEWKELFLRLDVNLVYITALRLHHSKIVPVRLFGDTTPRSWLMSMR